MFIKVASVQVSSSLVVNFESTKQGDVLFTVLKDGRELDVFETLDLPKSVLKNIQMLQGFYSNEREKVSA